ncbi:MAG: ABC transporter ATP-binding protein [Epsilonproteobacteria bacterium]|nr:ABC transporter ATP-binding protein [Campylobacterota bacterium]NPA56808.1 ABC transporter ATP-binding protein [Campylobacterota bacterium]
MERQGTSPLLSVRALSHRFDYQLFEDLSFSLGKGESMAVIGKSGSGKSTLLHICSTLLPPRKGEVELFGRKVYSLPQRELLLIRRFHVGIVFQSHYLFKGFTAMENIEVAAIMAEREIDRRLLERFGILHVLDKKVSELSGGEQQRVSIARVLSKRPKIIFADEPTGNLDGQTAQEVMEVIFDYVRREAAALFLVTHDEELARSCKRLYRLEERRLIPLQ